MIGKNRDAIDEIEAITIATQQPITLEAFLKLPETQPASEYITWHNHSKANDRGQT